MFKFFNNSLLTWLQSFRRKIGGLNRLFIFTVAVPTALAILYWGLIASDIYVSESHFVVRSPQQQTMAGTGLVAALQGIGFSQPGGDPYAVKDFILSRDALRQLDDKLHLAKLFGGKNVDFVNRFGGPVRWEKDFEALQRYYEKKIGLDIDTSSSIGTLTVEAFNPEDAYRINEQLLKMSERLVNWMNVRAQKDAILFAENEVAKAEAKAEEAELVLSLYRNKKGIFDPERQSFLQLEQVSKLQEKLITAKIQLAEILSASKDNPQIPILQKGIETLQTEIDAANAKVAGDKHSFSDKSAEYERLVLERDFAGKEFAAALAFLEQARYAAQRQQLYLERVVQPNKPDMPKPRRLRNVTATLLIGLIAWGILIILIAGVREHREK